MKTFIFSAAIAFSSLAASVANAQVIFDAVAGDEVIALSNGTNTPPVFASTPPTATLSRTDGGLSHFVSNNDILTLNGGVPLTATDVVTITWVVDNITGYVNEIPEETTNPNGIEFGVLPNAAFRSTQDNVGTLARFRADHPTIVNANRVGNGFGNLSADGPGQTENEPTVEGNAAGVDLEATGASFADGFTVVQTISAAGVTTQYRDIVVTDQVGAETGGTVLTTELEPFDETFDYVGFINGGHFYAGSDFDRSVTTGGVVTFSLAQIEISDGTTSTLLGDVNLDGDVNFLDITPFISILANDGFQLEADIDGNGVVDFLDITPFIGLLAGS